MRSRSPLSVHHCEGTQAARPGAYRRDWMPMSRVSILLLFTVSTISALGHAQSATRTSRPIAMDLAHINALNRNVVAADFNGDGIIDLAASDISSPIGI